MAKREHRPSRHTSIIGKIVDGNGSDDSDCISVDGESTPRISRKSTDESKQTIALTQSQPTSTITSKDSDEVFELPRSIPQYLHENNPVRRGGIFFPSPNLNYQRKQQEFSSFGIRPSQSLNNLSHPRLQEQLTADSGTGDSVEHIPTIPTTPDYQDDAPCVMVEIFGQKEVVALMKNRYEFDQAILNEHKKKQRFFNLRSPKLKSPAIEEILPLNKTNSKKSPNFITRIFKSQKQSLDNTYFVQPIFRHHSSKSEHKESE